VTESIGGEFIRPDGGWRAPSAEQSGL